MDEYSGGGRDILKYKLLFGVFLGSVADGILSYKTFNELSNRDYSEGSVLGTLNFLVTILTVANGIGAYKIYRQRKKSKNYIIEE